MLATAGGVDAVEVVELVLAVAFWASAAVLYLRFPGRTVGVAAGLTVWTAVGPWAGWLVLGVTVAAAVVYRQWGPGDRGGLLGHPVWAALALAAAGALLAEGTTRRVCVWVLAVAAGWLACVWLSPWLRARRGRRGLARTGSTPARADDDRALAAASMVVIARCQRCDGVLVASGEHTPAGSGEPARGVARATCTSCGARFVGLSDPADPEGGLRWQELPAGRREGVA